MDPLEGDAYERLVRLNVQLLGCGAIISSLALKYPLPKKKKNQEIGGLCSVSCGKSQPWKSINVVFKFNRLFFRKFGVNIQKFKFKFHRISKTGLLKTRSLSYHSKIFGNV